MALAGESALGGVTAFRTASGVVDAGHRFAKRRLEPVGQWKPSVAELVALHALVNRKASRAIM